MVTLNPGCIIRFQNFHSYGNFGNELLSDYVGIGTGPLVYDTVKHQPSGCKRKQTSSLIQTKFFNERLGNHSIEKLKVEQRDEDPLSSSHGAVASSSIAATPAPEEKEKEQAAAAAVLPNPRGLKKYFCFLPF